VEKGLAVFRRGSAFAIFAVLAVIIFSSNALAQQSVQSVQVDDPSEGARILSDARLFPSRDFDSVPPNIEMPSSVAAHVRTIWLRSPTFRRQCARIALASNWRIRVMFTGVPFGDAWAKTNFEHLNGSHRANVMLVGADTRMVELLGHEFEHVLEQFDGVDLTRLEEMGARGVRRLSSHAFETERAIGAGKRVAQEFALATQQARTP
jgi:hypothetical protein